MKANQIFIKGKIRLQIVYRICIISIRFIESVYLDPICIVLEKFAISQYP